MKASRGRTGKRGGILSRLRRDVRGNVLIITVFALIPLIALVGSGIDLSRLYLVKARLQHACDAGALAGRKTMGAGTWAQVSPNPPTIANQFFDGNFKSDGQASSGLTRTYTESGGRVSGVATVNVPMTLMRFFGSPTRTLTVNCDAQMNVPNTDVMFVLDTTGSMNDPANVADSATKIISLKNAVKCFYESVAQQLTNGVCPSARPLAGAQTPGTAQIRFGFMPYSMDVNVGKLLPTSYFADSWNYSTRTKVAGNNTGTWGPWSATSGPVACSSIPANTATTQYQIINTVFVFCTYQSRTYSGTPMSWHYARQLQDVSGLKNGTSWNSSSSITLPIGTGATAKTIQWYGCIEERTTVRTTDFSQFPPAGAHDLDIDEVPTQSNPDTLWGPALPDILYTRGWSYNPVDTTTDDTTNASSMTCPSEARRIQTWSSTTAFDNYVDGLQVGGNTYHDIGLLWGARFMSPTGIFAYDNTHNPAGTAIPIQRYMIFMTDGDTNTGSTDENAYGVAQIDRLQTPTNAAPTFGEGNTGTATQQVNLRFAAICTAVKNKGVNLFVVSFGGSGISSDTKNRLQACATDKSHYYDATNAVALQAAFQSIATQITQLRLVR